MSSDEYGVVESILASVQWDRWQFMLSAPKLTRQDIAVISHSHQDHWATNLVEKHQVLAPRTVKIPSQFQGLRAIVPVDYSVAISKRLRLARIWTRRLERILGHPVTRLHGDWWIASSGEASILHVADLNLHEPSPILEFAAHMLQTEQSLTNAILPSYGSLRNAHGARGPAELSNQVQDLVFDLKDLYRLRIAALPNPLVASWADYNAAMLPSIADVATGTADL